MREHIVITLCDMRDAHAFANGARLATGPRPGLFGRIRRWLKRENLRVVSVDHDVGCVTLERCR